jgi:hypothetical protein
MVKMTNLKGTQMKTENKKEIESTENTNRTQKYDPKQEYFNRMTPTARSAYNRRQSHQFANSIGGDSSNYRF